MTSLRIIMRFWFEKRIRELLSIDNPTKKQEEFLDFLIENYFKLYEQNKAKC